MSRDKPQRRLAAILSADAVGYSRLMGRDDVETVATLTSYRDVMGSLVRQHGGHVVDDPGDNLLAEFPSVIDATACAHDIQRELATRNAERDEPTRMAFRIGVHLGDVVVEGERIYGTGVNVAARIEALAEAGGICISGAVYEQVRSALDHAYEDLGERDLKNIDHPVRVFRIAPTDGPPSTSDRLDVPGFSGRPAVAVLPFDNLSGDPEQEYLADGIVEDLLTLLASRYRMPVIARNSSFTYKGRSVDVVQASRELGARYIVEGSVRRAGSRVRVSVQLIDATGQHVWADRYDRDLHDLFALQDEITEAIAEALGSAFQQAERQRALRKPPESLDAWDCIQRASWHMGQLAKRDFTAAREHYERAIELEPQLARAHSGLSATHLYELFYLWSDEPARAVALGIEGAERAVALDPNDHVSHLSLGWACIFQGNHERAIVSIERALQLNPSATLACWGLGVALNGAGRPEEGIAMIERAIRLSPHDPQLHIFLQTLGIAHFGAGRLEDAIACAERLLRMRPDQPHAQRLLAASYGHLGRVEEGRAALDEMFRLSPDFSLEALRLVNSDALIDRMLEGWRKVGWTG